MDRDRMRKRFEDQPILRCMRQRICYYASGILIFLICDEPTTSMATKKRRIIDTATNHDIITTILYYTHDLGVVASIADKVAVMYAGRV